MDISVTLSQKWPSCIHYVCVCVCMCVHGCVRMEGAGPTSHTLSCRSELPQTLNWVREKSTPLTNGRTEAIFSLSPDYFNSSVNSTRQSVTRPSILTSLIVDNQPHNHMMLCDIMIYRYHITINPGHVTKEAG